MSTLIVSECKPSVYQPIKADKNMHVFAIRPHLYIHGSPAGTIKVQVQDANGYVVAESATQVITSLKALAHAHYYIRFDVKASLIKNISYRLAVVCGGGYSFSESAYVGVCLDWDRTKINMAYTPANSYQTPLDFEIWERLTK